MTRVLLAVPLSYVLGIGGAVHVDGHEMELRGAAEASLDYRVTAWLGAGVHTRLTRAHSEALDGPGPGLWSLTNYNLRVVDVGVEVELTRGRFALRPWAGAHLASGRAVMQSSAPAPVTIEPFDPPTLLTGGLLASADLVVRANGRVAAFVDVQSSVEQERRFGWTYHAVTFGVALRR